MSRGNEELHMKGEVVQRTRTALTTVLVQTTKWKKDKATMSGYILEDRRRITIGDSPCSELLINTVLFTCLLNGTMLPGKRELVWLPRALLTFNIDISVRAEKPVGRHRPVAA
ncbi:hypothetical protein T09_12002 [Trichinella sp. T9]|nr:hypothetical protein T09_12002 [Trichinella sp. T9]